MFYAKSNHFAHLITLLDVLLSTLVYLILLHLYPQFSKGADPDFFFSHLGILVLMLAAFISLRMWTNQKLSVRSLSARWQAFILLREQALTVATCACLIFLLKLGFVSRLVLVGYFLVNTAVLISARMFVLWWYLDKQRKRKEQDFLRILIVGSGRRAHLMADRLVNELDWGVSIIGFLDPEGQSAGRRKSDKILGDVSQISKILRDNVVDEVIVAVPRTMIGDVQAIVDSCQEEGVTLRFMGDLYDFDAAHIHLEIVKGIPLLTFEPVAMAGNYLITKRIFDLAVAATATLVFIPLFVLVAIAIKMDSSGPVFFVQERVGLHKRRFRMVKFRSMVTDAEEKMKELEHLNEVKGPNFKIKADPRITRIGQLLRRSSIDELPQLLNVVRGDMSLVGPRPMTPRDVERFDRGIQRKRFSARPGLTCIWQISGRSDIEFEDWLKLDLQYIYNWSFWLDMKILAKTIPAVLKGNGAA